MCLFNVPVIENCLLSEAFTQFRNSDILNLWGRKTLLEHCCFIDLVFLLILWYSFFFPPLTLLLALSCFPRQLSNSVWWNPWWQWSLSFFRPLGNTEMETLSMLPQQLTHCHSQHKLLPEHWFLILWLSVLCHHFLLDTGTAQTKVFSFHNVWAVLVKHTLRIHICNKLWF